MKALVINSAEKADLLSDAAYQALVSELKNRGAEVETFVVRDEKLAYCAGCFNCWVKTPGVCGVDDAGPKLAKAVIKSDVVFGVTPVTYGGYSHLLKKAVERLVPLISPYFAMIGGETHHKPRYKRYPSLVAVGVLPREDQGSEKLFAQLVQRQAINFLSPSCTAVVVGKEGRLKIAGEIERMLDKEGAGA